MEIALHTQNNCLALWHALLHVRPLPRKLDSCLDCLSTCVHWQDHVVPKHLGDLLGKASEDAVMESPR